MSNTNLYTRVNPLYDVTIASDGTGVSYIDPTEGPQQIPDITGNAGEFLRVNAAGDNIEWTSFTTGGGLPVNQVNLGDGTDAAPSLTFQTDTDLGLRRAGANHLRVVGGSEILADFNTTHFRPRKPIHAEIGSAAAPSYSWESDPDTGIYRKGANNLSISAGALDKIDIKASETDFKQTSNFQTSSNITSLTNIINPLTASSGLANSNNWTSVAFDGSRYRAVCPALISNNFAQSIDGGLTWTIFSANVSWGNPNFIIWFSSRWYAFTTALFPQYLLNTTTGTTSGWAFTSYTGTAGGNILLTLAKVVNNQLLVTTTTGLLRVTTDGTNWTQQTAAIATNKSIVDIAYNSVRTNLYVAVASNGGIYYATGTSIVAGTTWTSVSSLSAINFRSVIYSPKLDLFVAFQLDSPYAIYASRDGINWDTSITLEPIGIFTPTFGVWIDDYDGFFLVGQNGATQMLVSRDGMTWNIHTPDINVRPSSFHYDSSAKRLVMVGEHAAGVFISASSVFSSNAPTPNFIKNVVNIDSLIDYAHQILSNGFFSVSAITAPVINCDTTSGNTQLMLYGASLPGNTGLRYKIRKVESASNNVQISTTDSTRLLNPATGNITAFNPSTPPINIIPAGYFGSVELVLVSSTGNKIWMIDNTDVYDANGVELKLNSVLTLGGFRATGRVESLRLTDGILEGTAGTVIHTTSLSTPYNLAIRRDQGSATDIKQVDFTDLGTAGLGFVFYMWGEADQSLNVWQIKNSSGQSMYYYTNTWNEVLNGGVFNIAAGNAADYNTYYCNYRTSGGQRRWIVRRLSNA